MINLLIAANSLIMFIFKIPYSDSNLFWVSLYWFEIFFCAVNLAGLVCFYTVPGMVDYYRQLIEERGIEDFNLWDLFSVIGICIILISWGAFKILPIYVTGCGLSFIIEKLSKNETI